jgi:DNA-binding NarL/FixJ family response regulator
VTTTGQQAPLRKRARIGIVDDHPTVLLGTMGILRAHSDLQVVAAVETVPRLFEQTTRLDLVLLDLVLADGSTPTQNMRRLDRLDVPVLAFSSGDRPAMVPCSSTPRSTRRM